jgi:hypothetical protein
MVTSQPAGFQNIGADNLSKQAAKTKELGETAGAGILGSETGQAAMALRERLEGVKKQGAANIENAKAQKKEAEGQQNVQQGGAQEKIGQTMVTTGTALVAAGPFTIWPGLAMIATGSGVSLMGSNQQQQGQQQVEEAPAYQSKANDLSGQSETHFSTAQQLQSEAETEESEAATEDPSGAKTQGQQKGYFVGDNLADASSSDEDESPIDKLRNGADKINGMGSKTIAAMTGNINVDDATQSLETKKETVG